MCRKSLNEEVKLFPLFGRLKSQTTLIHNDLPSQLGKQYKLEMKNRIYHLLCVHWGLFLYVNQLNMNASINVQSISDFIDNCAH